MINVKVKRVNPRAVLPEYATTGAAGFDLRACLDSQLGIQVLYAGERTLVDTGLAFEVPAGLEMQVRPRSGLSREGIDAVIGTIDSDYRGTVKIMLVNNSGVAFPLRHNERIAQGVLAPVASAVFEEANELTETTRGTGGFGHTGRS